MLSSYLCQEVSGLIDKWKNVAKLRVGFLRARGMVVPENCL